MSDSNLGDKDPGLHPPYTMDKSSMTETGSYCAMPFDIAISLGEGGRVTRIGKSNALFIGELPSNLKEIYNDVTQRTSGIGMNLNLKQIDEDELDTSVSRSPSAIAGVKARMLPFLKRQTDRFTGITTRSNEEKTEEEKEVHEDEYASKKDEPVRELWTRKTEFLLAIIGFSVDLGNIWRCRS